MTAPERPRTVKAGSSKSSSRVRTPSRLLAVNGIIAVIAVVASGIIGLLGSNVLGPSSKPTPTISAAVPGILDFSIHPTGINIFSVTGTASAIPPGNTIWLIYKLQQGSYFPISSVKPASNGHFNTSIHLSFGQPERVVFLYAVLVGQTENAAFKTSQATGLAALPSDVLILSIQSLVFRST
jgi:hypothetical protein